MKKLEENKKDYEILSEYLTENKRGLFEKVLSERTRQVTVVVENIYQPHNASAVLRSCDCFGVQDVHIIENDNEYEVNPGVAMGAAKWLNLFHYNEKSNNTVDCIETLKERGYAIAATTPHQDDIALHEVPLDKPIAFMFGTEAEGLSQEAIDRADVKVRIPMYGFTESFNISVSAALCLQNYTDRLRATQNYQLSEEEQWELRIEWARKVVRNADGILDERKRNS